MSIITDVPDPAPPGRLATWCARPSSRVFAGALALAIAAVALTLYQRNLRRQFAEPTTTSMGAVLRSGSMLGGRRRPSSQALCWVSYEFTPAGGARQENWRLWEPGCGVSPGRPINIQYVVARPEVNRPAGENWSFPPLLVWLAAGVMVVVGFLLRWSREPD